ncbi:MAG: M48 family peptidase [Candidatus Electrothrix sp. GM3_4]|nr:M48 family peptidase [Candidatus Electrothrix sp. GM3_4]
MSFAYQVRRRPRRKTASISVQPDCSVQILVPSFLSDLKIEELVQRKIGWINNKISQFEEIRRNSGSKQYVSGECFTYLGRNYRLKVVPGVQEEYCAKLLCGRFHVYVSSCTGTGTDTGTERETHDQLVIRQLSAWYRRQAALRLREKTKRYAERLLVAPVSVGIKEYRARWGSCHADGRIYYNWRIIAAPHSVVDYVVVHELCHLVHPDHSPRFWKLLATILPDYTERKAWLKVNGGGLGA